MSTLNRRQLLASLICISVSSIGRSATPEWILPYAPHWNINKRLGSCQDIRGSINELKDLRLRIKSDNAFVQTMKADKVRQKDELIAEAALIDKNISTLSTQQLIQKIAIVLGLSLTAVGLVITSTFAAAALLGLEIIAGTTILGLQAINLNGKDVPEFVFAYGSDRTITLGAAVADNAKSAGGKVLTSALSMVALVFDIRELSQMADQRAILHQRLYEINSKSKEISRQIGEYESKPLIQWKAYFDNILEGTINSLERYEKGNAVSDCRLGGLILPRP